MVEWKKKFTEQYTANKCEHIPRERMFICVPENDAL